MTPNPSIERTFALMTKLNLTLVGFFLVGCASTQAPEYQVGDPASSPKQNRATAEQAHAASVLAETMRGYDSPAQVISSRFPDYPPAWRNANIEGAVVIQFTVGIDGNVSNPTVLGSPPAELAAIALHAIMQWKFKPAMKNGQPTAVRVQQDFEFKVE